MRNEENVYYIAPGYYAATKGCYVNKENIFQNKVYKSNIISFYYFFKNRSSRPKVFCKKGVLKNFANFTGKHLRTCWGTYLGTPKKQRYHGC